MKVTGASEAARAVESLDRKIDQAKGSMQGFDAKIKGLGSGLSSLGGRISGAGGTITKLGAKMTAFTLPLTLAGKKAFSWAKDLDTAVRQVSTLTTDGVLPIDKIKKEVLAMSDATGMAQTEVANAMYEALSAGIDESKVTDFTKRAIALSEAGFTDLSTSIDATTTILNAYGDKAFSVSKISDILVKTQDKGKITVDELAKSIGRVIPTAAAAGVNVDQLGAAYSILTAKGMNARIATTNLEGMLGELSTTGSGVDKVLRMRTGKSFAQLTDSGTNLGEVLQILQKSAEDSGLTLKDMFSQSTAGSAALSILSDGVDGYTSALSAMNNAQGATAKNAEKMHGSAYTWGKATEKIKNTMIDLGDAIAPVIIPIADKISGLVTKFRDLSPEVKSFVVKLGLITIAAGPILAIIGPIMQGLGGIISVGGGLMQGIGSLAGTAIPALGGAASLLTGPFGLIVLAIGSVIALGVILVKNWDKIKAGAVALGEGLKTVFKSSLEFVGNLFRGLWGVVEGVFNGIKAAWEGLKGFLKNPIKGVVNIVGGIFGGGKGNNGKNTVPSHATGLDTVPHDNYLANLHAGEMVLTKKAASLYKAIGGDKDSVPIYNTYNSNNNSRSYDSAPIVNINVDVKGDADKRTAEDIADKVRSEVDNIFKELKWQRV